MKATPIGKGYLQMVPVTGILLIMIVIVGFTPSPKFVAAANSPVEVVEPSPPIEKKELTCAAPTPEQVPICREIEAQILSSTVRIQIQSWVVNADESGYAIQSSFGHGTVMDGRNLVTHNHYEVPLSFRDDEENRAYGVVILSDTAGKMLFKGPLADFEPVWDDPGTLIITHQDDDLLAGLGLTSASFQDWTNLSLQRGMEVAQIDWDGAITRVDWTTIQAVTLENGMPQLILAGDTRVGASGGGIFVEGIHLGNNWFRQQQFDRLGNLIGTRTAAALNTAQLVDISGG